MLVIGGGIAGCATGYFLAAAGTDVAVVDRFDLNTQASGRNAGGLHGQIQYHPFAQFGEQWAADFLPALRLLTESIELWRMVGARFKEDLAIDLEVTMTGGVIVAETAAQLDLLRHKARIEEAAGVDVDLLGRAALATSAPYVSGRMLGGLLCRGEGKANPLVAAPAFAAAAHRHGARVLPRTRVVEVARRSGGFDVATSSGAFRCGKVVVTTGSDLAEFFGSSGRRPPVTSEPIQVSVTEPVAPLIPHLVAFAGGPLTMKQTGAGAILIGGGWPARLDADGSPAVDADSLRGNLRLAVDVVPAVRHARLVRSWAGVGTGTPDHRPIIGESSDVPGLFTAMFPYLGFTAGPVIGRLAAASVLGEPADRDMAPFSPDRF